MIKHIQLHKGLDIPVKGAAELKIEKTIISDVVSVKPVNFKNLTPKLLVREGDEVKAGSILFVDKYHPEVGFASPVSGTVEQIVRGEKRKLLEVRVKAAKTTDYIKFNTPDVVKATAGEIKKVLLESGLWVALKQRPYGIVANPEDEPRAIFVSAFDSAPLAPDYNFTLKGEAANIQVAVDVLNKLTKGGVFVGINAKESATSPFNHLKNVKLYGFSGAHPAGNVGVQINNIAPVNKGEVVWTIDPMFMVAVGKLFTKGIYDVTRTIAVAGNRVEKPCYVTCVPGTQIKDLDFLVSKKEVEIFDQECGCRYISGNVLTGSNVGVEGSLDFYSNMVTVISEGNYYEMFGWVKPMRFGKFSFSKSYFSWLTPKKKYKVDTNTNGGQRAFVVSDVYGKVLPMDIYPVYLLKAILAEDIDKMEQLGIYEVIEEDFALCEYVCPSKIDIQDIISKGIATMIKEMA
ncbi:MAG: Na(+)-translocating NADH-quinone reductase subunit A [Bacteroidales bacterium]|nr:Na(+)-translocating NADH-quinone reductase subunit A [Bacteroidales bacterium]